MREPQKNSQKPQVGLLGMNLTNYDLRDISSPTVILTVYLSIRFDGYVIHKKVIILVCAIGSLTGNA